jgi:serine/threonine protein kinase/WD40 repeat protein
MIESQAGREPVEELAEQFLARYRRGERPSITEYTRTHPDLAEEIRELFPALVVMEEAGPRQAGPAAFSGKITADGKALRRLGEYRILREIGRGGMGVVYEAEQEALGRHVALKVLPYAAADPVRLQRFCREARAAARLHHTNIVPVYDVGEHEGVHYYAMQFIQGQGLDEVLAELRRLRLGIDPIPLTPALSQSLAEGVHSGLFAPSAPSVDPLPASPRLGDSTSSSTHSDSRYFRSVAGLGLQVAEALAHAHGKKVLHRDIKPSNLLLDLYGRVWVTDFGLAKEEGEELTRLGDVVGTLRYMAPERFSGHSDVRGDIYSLGLTLYELLTLQPAFEESDRGLLIRQVTHQEPPPPRKLDRRVPRDLETIVLKAIAKEPPRRYGSAAEFAEDLRRFLADRPILARRTSWAGHAWRWVRRNPGWAATIALTLLLLVAAALGGTIQNFRLQSALTRTKEAERDKTDELWRSYLEQARAERSSGRVGQRFTSLRAIREAARIRVTPELRDEAIAALALPDVELVRELAPLPEGTAYYVFDASFRRRVSRDKHGGIAVHQLTDGGEVVIANLPADDEPPFTVPWISPDGRFVAYGSGFLTPGVSRRCRVWKVDGAAPTVLVDAPDGVHHAAIAFRPDHKQLALGHADGWISVYDLRTGQRIRRIRLGIAPEMLAFHPTDARLAAACGNAVRIFNTETGAELPPLRHAEVVTWTSGIAWHPDGKRLASACDDRRIHVWDVGRAMETMAPWTGDSSLGVALSFNQAGDRVVSAGWDGQTRLWDAATGRLMLTLPGFVPRFGVNDELLGAHSGKSAIWRLAAARELRVLSRHNADSSEQILYPVLERQGRIVAASAFRAPNSGGSQSWLAFFDLDAGEELASVPVKAENCQPVYSDPSGGWVTAGGSGILLWPLHSKNERGNSEEERGRPFDSSLPLYSSSFTIGPPSPISSARTTGVSASRDGRVLALALGGYAVVLDRNQPRKRIVVGPQYDVRNTAVSPDGCWVVSCSHWSDGESAAARVWHAESGRHVCDLPWEGSTAAAFSPDGRWLATYSTMSACQLWEVGTWRPGPRLGPSGSIAFSPDSKLAAIADVLGAVRLIEPETGREALRLTGPEATWYVPACFTPDGTRLLAVPSNHGGLYVWDLRLIRQGLESLGLATDWPERLPALGTSDLLPPVQLTVDARWARTLPTFAEDRLTIAIYTLAISACPLNPDPYFVRGQAHARQGDWRNAVADYGRYLTLAGRTDPRRSEVLLRRADLFERHGDSADALTDLQTLLKHESGDLGFWTAIARSCNNVAWHYVRNPKDKTYNPTEIVTLARGAFDLQPFNSAYRNTLGVALYRAGKYHEAIAQLEQNLSADRTSAGYDLFFLSMSHYHLGQPAKARERFAQANSWWKAHPDLRETEVSELTAFRTEAAELLGSSANR